MREKMGVPEERGQEETKVTDMEVAMFFATHIDNPCEPKLNWEDRKISGSFICVKPGECLQQ